jgi:hypothetical protein
MFILSGAGYAKFLLASFVFSYKRAECTLDTKTSYVYTRRSECQLFRQ